MRRADLIVSAAGHRHLIKGEWIKEGAIVIDVGINKGLKEDGYKLVGDVEFKEVVDFLYDEYLGYKKGKFNYPCAGRSWANNCSHVVKKCLLDVVQ